MSRDQVHGALIDVMSRGVDFDQRRLFVAEIARREAARREELDITEIARSGNLGPAAQRLARSLTGRNNPDPC